MLIAKAKSCGLIGLDGYIVEVEADISQGIPAFDMVGLPDMAVKESKERVRAAMKNCNLQFPVKRITINLAPANLKKNGPAYDLPITIALLAASGQLNREVLTDCMFLGELSLDGRVRPVSGVLPMVMAAKENGIQKAFVPAANAEEAAVTKGILIFPVENVYQLIKHLQAEEEIAPYFVDIDSIFQNDNSYMVDFSDVKGQEDVKRAVEVAVAGGHNILMIGSPGSGKSMIAQRIPTILPDLTFDEALEVTKIHSIAGVLPAGVALVTTRPFRNPHHTISSAGLAGGGNMPRPGELSLAHNGVLFMDELPEFHRDVLEVMRQPMEDGIVTISRVQGTLAYPCNALFVGSMNPCKCGYYGDDEHICQCTLPQVIRYRNKISGPLMDRIDIHIEVPSVKYEDLQSSDVVETSAQIKERINRARQIQLKRYQGLGIYSNSGLTAAMLTKFCKLDEAGNDLMRMAFDRLGLSARAHSRILKVARTIADLEQSEHIEREHIAEAIQYRSLDRDYTGRGI